MNELDESPPETPNPAEFDSENADVDPKLESRAAFSEVLAEHGFADTLVLGRERADAVFHERRLQIIDHLAENDPDSVRPSRVRSTSTKGSSVAIWLSWRNSKSWNTLRTSGQRHPG